jgi:drug/metabolite transporter (DMT)-like permease
VLAWGTDAAITKRFLLSSIAPAPMLTIRLAVAAVTLLPFGLREFYTLRAFRRKEWQQLAALILFGTLGTNLFYYESLTRTPAFLTLILYRLDTVFVIILSALILKKKTSLATIGLVILALISAAAISLGNVTSFSLHDFNLLGIGLVLAAALCSAIGVMVAKNLLVMISPLLLVTLRTGLASLFLLTWQSNFFLTQAVKTIPQSEWLLLIFLGVVYSGLTFWLYYKGLQATTPLIGSLIQLLRVVSGLVASYIILGEIPNSIQWVGTLGLMIVLFLLTKPTKDPALSALN